MRRISGGTFDGGFGQGCDVSPNISPTIAQKRPGRNQTAGSRLGSHHQSSSRSTTASSDHMRGVRPQVVGCTSPEGGAVRQGQGRRIVTQLDVAGDPDSRKMFHLGDVAGDPDSRKTFHLGNVSCGGYIGKPAHITHYFELLPVPVTPPPARPPSLPLFLQSIGNGPSVRYYAPGAGKVTAPINVEEWEASEPIDVDAFAESTETDNPSSSEVQAEVPGCPAQAAQADTVQTQAQKDARNAQLLFECCICGDTFVDPVVSRSIKIQEIAFFVLQTTQRTFGEFGASSRPEVTRVDLEVNPSRSTDSARLDLSRLRLRL
ncbi:hypothetical protein C8R44DRAFT_859438 [Mycena epipterygia]|nr:hypothetical protein C8R44DRAFT_859438 [Mycena epipterygia]